MRKSLTLIVGLVLVLAACGDDGGADSTSPGATEPSGTTAPTDVENTCYEPAEPVTCADYAPGVVSPLVDNSASVDQFIPQPLPDNQVCMVTDEVFTYPAIEGSLPDTITPADQGAFETLDTWFEAVQLGYYTVADGFDLFDVIDDLESKFGVEASPHYLVAPTQTWKYGPASIAQDIAGSWSGLPDMSSQTEGLGGARVIVIDTGGVADTARNVSSADPEPANLDTEVVGHGQFAASIVNRFNPNLTIDIRSASFEVEGRAYMTELSVVDAIGRAKPEEGDVVNLSLGGYPCRAEDPFIGLALGLALMPHEVAVGSSGEAVDVADLDVTFVAASGNDGEDYAMYPAELEFMSLNKILVDPPEGSLAELIDQFGGFDGVRPAVIAVGAADSNGDPADFSNRASVYAPGVDVVGWYEPTKGLAVWSGTSFAAPRFAACVASGVCLP